MQVDVAIVGAGPAGLCFARSLAGSGLTAAIIERQPLEAIAEPAIRAGETVRKNGGKSAKMGQYGRTQRGFLKPEGVTVKDTRNKRSVWTVATRPYLEAHFATYPPDLIRPCVLAGTRPGDTILDPFNGSGTTGQVALEHGRDYIGIDLNTEYLELARRRLAPLLAQPRLLEAV